jgi:hypothetical protein
MVVKITTQVSFQEFEEDLHNYSSEDYISGNW